MNQQELIAQAWALTEAIENAAADNDWPRAAELTQTRSPLLMGLQADQPADAMVIIRRIQASIANNVNLSLALAPVLGGQIIETHAPPCICHAFTRLHQPQ